MLPWLASEQTRPFGVCLVCIDAVVDQRVLWTRSNILRYLLSGMAVNLLTPRIGSGGLGYYDLHDRRAKVMISRLAALEAHPSNQRLPDGAKHAYG